MTIIEAKVTDQLLTVTNDPVVASGGVNDTSVLFSFCEKWNGFIKTAVFADANKQDWYDVVLDANNKAIVPAQVMATKGRFWFGVVGVKDDIKYTAKIVQYDVAEGAAISGEEPEIPQSTIDQILAAVGAHTESTSNPHNVTKEQIGLGNVDNNITNVVNANSGRISNHEKRLTNLEARISQEDFVEDSDVAYIKDVPANVLPYAELKKLGGMTYKDGDTLKHAVVTEVENVGANLIPYPYTNTTNTINGITFTDNGDGTITANGTATNNAILYVQYYSIDLKAGTYTISGVPMNGSASTVMIQLATRDGTFVKNHTSVNGDTFTLSTDTQSIVVQLVVFKGFTANNLVFKPMINKGPTALPHRPYTKTTFPIPEAVRPKNGINENVYDYIEWCANRTIKKCIRCAEKVIDNVIDSDISYNNVKYYRVHKPEGFVGYNSTSNSYVVTGFDYFDGNWDSADNIGKTTGCADYYFIWFGFPVGTTIEEAKAVLMGLTLQYELAEPIITDISDILPADNLIGVEGGGTLTFKNEHEFAVPSTVVYQVKSEVSV